MQLLIFRLNMIVDLKVIKEIEYVKVRANT